MVQTAIRALTAPSSYYFQAPMKFQLWAVGPVITYLHYSIERDSTFGKVEPALNQICTPTIPGINYPQFHQ